MRSVTAFTVDPAAVAGCLDRLRGDKPRVHCITNSAAVNFTANVLLAAGAIPSMTVNPEEISDFVASADAVLVNLGTLDPLRIEAVDAAVTVARDTGLSWALDPVFVDRSPSRLSLAKRLVEAEPALIRLNSAELSALTGGGRQDQAADTLALESMCVVARTGETDYVTDGARAVGITGGHAFMSMVTATGCATTALMAGFLAVEPDAVVAAASCLAFVAAAAEIAGAKAEGPGSFSPAFIDALSRLSPEDVAASARFS